MPGVVQLICGPDRAEHHLGYAVVTAHHTTMKEPKMSHLEYAARYHQQELLREARDARLAREAHPGHERHTALRHQLTSAVVSLLMIVALVALI